MKRIKKQKIIGLLLCMTSLISYSVDFYFTKEWNNNLIEVNSLFDLSIRDDKSTRMFNLGAPVYGGYSNEKKESSLVVDLKYEIEAFSIKDSEKLHNLSLLEKSYRSAHSYLQYKTPIQVHVLDSLFKSKLQNNNILLQTEIQYIADNDTAYSTDNYTFYTTASPLKKITTGVSDEIELQAFVKMPFYYRISNFTSIAVCLLFFISISGLIGISIRKKDEEELQTISETDSFILPPTSDLFKYAKQITPTIFFNEKKEAIIRNGETIYLTASRLTVFTLMMGDDDYFVPTATIKAHLWPKNDDIKNVLNKMIERLRIDLRPIPELEVLYDRKRKGYYLKVVENAFVNPKHIHEVSIFENIYIQTKTIIAKFCNNNSKDEGVAC